MACRTRRFCRTSWESKKKLSGLMKEQNDDELKKLWQQQPLRNPDLSAAEMISAMQNKTTLLRRCLDTRDFRELLACAEITPTTP